MAALTESELPQAGRALRWRLASDSVLARGATNGAEGAFDEIYVRYQPALVRHCRAVLLDADEAQDAAQNALTSALRALRRGTSDPVSLKAWLYRIAHNEAVALAKRRADQQARRMPGDGSEVELIAVDGPADDDTRRRLEDLVTDLHELPDRQRSALLLRELSGLGYDEIADVLGTTAGACRQTVFEARAALVDIGAGRDDACDGIRRLLSDGDGRARRGRRLRAHVRTCAGCTDFAMQIDRRENDLAIIFPIGPVLALFGGGGAAASVAGGAAAAGSGWSLGIGATAAVKCATVCAAAALLGAAIEQAPIQLPGGGTPTTTLADSGSTALPPRPHATSPVVLAHVAQARAPRPARHAATRSHAPRAANSFASVSVPRSQERRTAHVPTFEHAKAVHTGKPADTVVPTTPVAQTTTTQTASTTPSSNTSLSSRHNYSSFIPQVAQQAVAAATQQAGNIVQSAMAEAQAQMTSGLALAQQLAASAMHAFSNRGTSVNVPASTSAP